MESRASVYILGVLAVASTTSDLTHPDTGSVRTFTVLENGLNDQEAIAPTHGGNSSLPMVLKSQQPCKQSEKSYCLNGICQYHEDPDQDTRHPICICNRGFTGTRCQHALLTSHAVKKTERDLYITVGIGIGLLLSGLAVLLAYYLRMRCEKSKTQYNACSIEARI
ncbi:epigen-like isoform X2 [Narcine bancroftii]|uniref:epigen-like isoform X2 n=1 Tax=Narcine bancroftii TaxID=1343680 RepID=UPI003831DE59